MASDILYFLPYCLIQDKACDAMEIFDELVESEVSIVTPHVKALIEFCLQVCEYFIYSVLNSGHSDHVKCLQEGE